MRRKLMKSLLIMLVLPLILTSCAMFERRSYEDVMFDTAGPMWVPNRDFQVVGGDTGRVYRDYNDIMQRTPASFETMEEQEYAYSLRTELVKLENLQNEKDYELYDRHRFHFGSDSERIYYLRLNPSERISYLKARGFMGSREGSFGPTPSAQRAYARAYSEGEPAWQAPNYQETYPAQPMEWRPRESSRAPASLEYSGY